VSAAATQPVDDAAQIVDLLLAQPVKRPVEQVVDRLLLAALLGHLAQSYSRQPPGRSALQAPAGSGGLLGQLVQLLFADTSLAQLLEQLLQ